MKRAARKVFRSRWLAMSAFAALTALASVAAATTNSTAGPNPVSNPAHPVVDARWIYANDWYNATHFIYKRAGSDGCLQGATTCGSGGGTPGDLNNLPMNYNGTQEFNKWWGELGTTSTPLPNGELGKFISKRDHLFPQASWQINVQELTIPGATCGGEQVMLAFHPDSQGVGQPNPGSSGTPLSTMYSGDWGTGSPYDSNMGALMNLEEIGSVLRWHKLNGTYPKRTIKTAVFDAELQGLIGSGQYSSAGTAAAVLTAPVSVGDSNIKVTSNANLTVGSQIAIDESAGNTENGIVQTQGSGQALTTSVLPTNAGDTNIKVASVTTNANSGWVVGQLVNVDTGANQEQRTLSAVGTAARTATTLAAAAAAGATNIKVTAVTAGTTPLFVVGEPVTVGTGAGLETSTVAAIGTAGAAGTGITLNTALAAAHASGEAVRDVGTGITVSTPLTLAHASGTQLQELGSGITLTAPLTKAHPIGTTVNGPATGLISDSPQGQIVGVLNNDQNGINYPALHWGTDHYLNNLVNGGVGPWFNNINATPVSPAANNVYGTVGIQRLQHNLPAVVAFRTNVENAVTQALHDLGEKYNYSIPVENPMLLKNTGSTPDNPLPTTLPSYLPADQAQYTPVQDDRTGRTDQVSFGVRGIPSLGNIGVYDSSTNPLVGGNENPYPASYPSKPGISFLYGQDTMSDNFPNLNFYASGRVHGPGGYDDPSEGLIRGVEFVATYFSYAVASDSLGGKVDRPNRPIAYFEQNPKKATSTTTVTYDAGFSRSKNGDTKNLTYYWDFGDGTPLVSTTDPTIQHTFPTQAGWYDVKLLVSEGKLDANTSGFFRQVEPIDFFPTYYPAVPPASEPLPPTSGAAADTCGVLSPEEQSAMLGAAGSATPSTAQSPSLNEIASVALTDDKADKAVKQDQSVKTGKLDNGDTATP